MKSEQYGLRSMIHLPLLTEVNFSDLVSSFVSFLDIPGIEESLNGRTLLREIEPKESMVFVFTDALGSCFLPRLPDTAFLNRNKIRDIQSVFPSTTPCAMFNCSTGLEPALHGIPGRWTHLKDRNSQVTTFTITERFFGDLTRQGEYPTEEVWETPSIYTRTGKDVFFVIPGIFTDSLFEKYLCGNKPVGKYNSVAHAVDLLLDALLTPPVPAFSFLYLMDLDELLHNKGTEVKEVDNLLLTINNQLERLAVSLPSGCRLCISADHGQINIPFKNRIALYDGNPLLDLLETPPYGEPRTPHFLVKAGREDDFRSLFRLQYGEVFHLFSREDASKEKVFGRNELSARANELYGNFIGVAKGRHTLRYYPDGSNPGNDHFGEHGGTDPEEITIPLILA